MKAAGDADGSKDNVRKVQKNRKRCWECRKKVGLTGGIECRCKYVFCAKHRYADDHNCDFDFQAMQRDVLTNANTKLACSKLDRL